MKNFESLSEAMLSCYSDAELIDLAAQANRVLGPDVARPTVESLFAELARRTSKE